jgi:hypothetical protein
MNRHWKAKADFCQCCYKYTKRYASTNLHLSSKYKEQCLLRAAVNRNTEQFTQTFLSNVKNKSKINTVAPNGKTIGTVDSFTAKIVHHQAIRSVPGI